MLDILPSHPSLPPLMTGEELAAAMRYTGVISAFRGWLKTLDIKSVPGRNGLYDPHHVRHRLDVSQGMIPRAAATPDASEARTEPIGLTDKRRLRRGK